MEIREKWQRLKRPVRRFLLSRGSDLCSDQEIRNVAQRDGAHSLPHAVGDRSTMQHEIVDGTEAQKDKYGRFVRKSEQRCEDELNSIKLNLLEQVIVSHVKDAAYALRNIQQVASTNLTVSLRAIAEKLKALKQFRLVNDLDNRLPDYPESGIFASIRLVVIAIGEACLNAFYFAGTGSLLDGGIVALGVSTVNVGLACLVGVVCGRRMSHANTRMRLWSRRGVVVWVIFIVCFHAFIAFTRYPTFVDTGEIGWVVLFLAGLFSAGWGFAEGYTGLDDRYAHYGAVDRACQFAHADHTAILKQFRDDVNAVVSSAVIEINLAFLAYSDKVVIAQELINRVIRDVEYALEMEAQVDRRCLYLLHVYDHEICKLQGLPSPTCSRFNVTTASKFDDYIPHLRTSLKTLKASLGNKCREAQEAISSVQALGEYCIANPGVVAEYHGTHLPHNNSDEKPEEDADE